MRDNADMPDAKPEPAPAGEVRREERAYVRVHELRPDDYDGSCLRPLGLCELGGCCDVCWYRPDHPRFRTA